MTVSVLLGQPCNKSDSPIKMDLSRVFTLIATLSLQEKPRVSLKKFVKIGRSGYKGRKPTGSRQIRSVHKLLTGFVRTACFKLLKQVW